MRTSLRILFVVLAAWLGGPAEAGLRRNCGGRYPAFVLAVLFRRFRISGRFGRGGGPDLRSRAFDARAAQKSRDASADRRRSARRLSGSRRSAWSRAAALVVRPYASSPGAAPSCPIVPITFVSASCGFSLFPFRSVFPCGFRHDRTPYGLSDVSARGRSGLRAGRFRPSARAPETACSVPFPGGDPSGGAAGGRATTIRKKSVR